MSTDAVIIKEEKNGIYKGVEANSDGFIDYVGAILYHDYQNPKKIQKLMYRGDIFQLGSYIGKYNVSFPVLDKYGEHYQKNPKFQKLPLAKRQYLSKIADRDYTSFIDVDTIFNNSKRLKWSSFADVIRSIKNKQDSRFDNLFYEYAYVYRNHTWYVIRSNEYGLTPHLTLKYALHRVNSANRKRKAKEERQKAYNQAMDELYSIN